jgi:hypothetical protein
MRSGIFSKRARSAIATVALVAGLIVLPGGTGAYASGTCRDAKISRNLKDAGLPGVRSGAVNLQVYWCWDGQKIVSVGNPVVWTSTTWDGTFIKWTTNTPVLNDKDPQNGGYWTKDIVITGTVENCVFKYGCIPPIKPFKLELLVFGDGVQYPAR